MPKHRVVSKLLKVQRRTCAMADEASSHQPPRSNIDHRLDPPVTCDGKVRVEDIRIALVSKYRMAIDILEAQLRSIVRIVTHVTLAMKSARARALGPPSAGRQFA